MAFLFVNQKRQRENKNVEIYEKMRLYFERLPATKHALDVSHYEMSICPPICKFQSLLRLHLEFNHLSELPADVPDSVEFLTCYGNKLTSIARLPQNLKMLDASYNALTSLPAFPLQLAHLNLFHNQLTQLPPWHHLPLVYINVNKNQLTKLPCFPPTMRELSCDKNQLFTLPPLPETLQNLSCEYNPIVRLPMIPTNCEQLFVEHTEIYEAFCLEQTCVVEIKRRLNVVARFRELYYTLKYKRRWLDLLWLQVRLPKIERDNHPDRLREALASAAEGVDLESLLSTFGTHSSLSSPSLNILKK